MSSNVDRCLRSYTSDFSYVSSPCLNEMYNTGLSFSAYDSSTWSIDDAMLSDLGVDVLFAGVWDSSTASKFVLTETHESTNLAMAEYLKLFGALYNVEATANTVFAEIEQRWTCTSANVDTLAAARPQVLWASWL